MSWFRPKRTEAPAPEPAALPSAPSRPAATGVPDDDDEIPIDVTTGITSAVSPTAATSGARSSASGSGASASGASGSSARASSSGATAAASGSGAATSSGGLEARTTLTDDTTVIGTITTASDLWIAGRIEGDIESGAAVHIAADGAVIGDVVALRVRIDHGGTVEGSVEAGDAAISGKVRGSVSSTGRLAIASSGEVVGDVTAHSLHVDDGATLQGRCTMSRGGTK